MSLFHLVFDGESYYVEALSMVIAITAWEQRMEADTGQSFDDDPEMVQLVHEGDVIRAEAQP